MEICYLKIKNVLIIGTAQTPIICQVIEDNFNKNIFLLIQQNRLDQFSKYRGMINVIKTDKKYIDFNTVKKENRIPKTRFEQIIILSTKNNNINDFGEAYAIAGLLKYKKIIWKGPDNKKVIEGNVGDRVADIIYGFTGIVQYKMGRILTKNISFLKGYKW